MAACPYLHVNLPASAPLCGAFLRGLCLQGAACPHKHFTLSMVKEERRLQAGKRRPSKRPRTEVRCPHGGLLAEAGLARCAPLSSH